MMTAEQKASFRRGLRRAREAAGYSQSGLSLKIGVSRSAVWQWEGGRAVPTEENVAALERELELQPGSLSLLLGYLPAGAVEREMISVIEALEADPKLGERERELLASMYRQLVKQREAEGRDPTAPSPAQQRRGSSPPNG
jgi:transcriptional regulator with XRE-family HTH domain